MLKAAKTVLAVHLGGSGSLPLLHAFDANADDYCQN